MKYGERKVGLAYDWMFGVGTFINDSAHLVIMQCIIIVVITAKCWDLQASLTGYDWN